MARRNTTPLFEIVSRNGNGQAAPAERASGGPASIEPKPAGAGSGSSGGLEATQPVRRERPLASERISGEDIDAVETPRPAPVLSPARESETREMPRIMGRMSVASGMVKLPVNYGYIGLSIVAVVVLLAWTGGYVLGGSSAEERARREIESATGGAGLVDPLAGGTDQPGQLGHTPVLGTEPRGEPRNANPDPRRVEPAGGGTPSNAGVAPVITQQRTRYLAAGGYFDREPRTPGLNYFCLVSRLPEADTRSALDFLSRNGVRAVGVERASSDANNRSFELYTLEGLSRDEYAGESGTDKRATHEALVAELGRRWRAEERGTSDFARPQWYRYNP